LGSRKEGGGPAADEEGLGPERNVKCVEGESDFPSERKRGSHRFEVELARDGVKIAIMTLAGAKRNVNVERGDRSRLACVWSQREGQMAVIGEHRKI
jgi:hypothetical protein